MGKRLIIKNVDFSANRIVSNLKALVAGGKSITVGGVKYNAEPIDTWFDIPINTLTTTMSGTNLVDANGLKKIIVDDFIANELPGFFAGNQALEEVSIVGDYCFDTFVAMCGNGTCPSLTKFSILGKQKVKSMESMFASAANLKYVYGFNNIDISECLSVGDAFTETQIEEIDLSGWNLPSSVDTSRMFAWCRRLKKVYVNGCSDDTKTKILSALNNIAVGSNGDWSELNGVMTGSFR